MGQRRGVSAYRRREHVDGINGRPSRLLVAKDQVYPATDIGRDVVRLQSLAMDEDKATGVAVTPRWQGDVRDRVAGLTDTKVKPWNSDRTTR